MQSIGDYPAYLKRQKRAALRTRTQRTYNAQYKDAFGIAREIDTYNLAFQEDATTTWTLVKRFDADLMLYGQRELVQAQAQADAR